MNRFHSISHSTQIALVTVCLVFLFPSNNADAQTAQPFKKFDRVTLENGDVIAFKSYSLTLRHEEGGEEIIRLNNTYPKCLAVFSDPENPNSAFLLTQVTHRNSGMELHRYNTETKTHETLIRTHERLRASGLTFQQLEKGNILVISAQGVLLHFRDGKHVDRLALDGFYQNTTQMFKPIEGLVAGNRAFFFSQVSRDYDGKALRDVIVFENNSFRELGLNDTELGPAHYVEGKIKFLAGDGLLSVDFETGETKKLAYKPPIVDGQILIPIKTFSTSDGKQIGIFRKPQFSEDKNDIEIFNNGYFTQIGEFDGTQWDIKSVGLDDAVRKWNIHFAEQANGRCWISATSSGRVVIRESNGEYRAINVPEIDSSKITGIEVGSGRITFRSANEMYTRMFFAGDLADRREKDFPNWTRLRLQTPLIPDADGVLYGISRKEGGRLLQIKGGEFEYFPLPPREEFRNAGFTYITADTLGNVWLFSDRQQRTAVFEGDRWTVYKPDEAANLTSKQVAFVDRLEKVEELEGYRIGVTGYFQIRFWSGKQIVFRNKHKRVAYYDGENWHAPTSGREFKYSYASTNPFIYNNLICFTNRSNVVLGMTRNSFLEMDNVNKARPWKAIKIGEKLRNRLTGEYVRWKPQTKSLSGGRTYDNYLSWIEVLEGQFAVALRNQYWSVIPSDNTPLEEMKSPLITGAQKNLFIFKSKYNASGNFIANNDQFAWRAPNVSVFKAADSLGELDSPGQELTATINTVPPDSKVHRRFRIENDRWSPWKPLDEPMTIRGLDAGEHQVEVQFNFDDRLALAETLSFDFTTTYSLNEVLEKELEGLASETESEQVSAREVLLKIGPPALDRLYDLVDEADGTPVAPRAKALAAEIERLFGES